MVSRRKFLQSSAALSTMAALPLSVRWHIAQAATAAAGLSDPFLQPKFVNPVPDALDPGFIYDTRRGKTKVTLGPSVQQTGLVDPLTSMPLNTPVLGYGQNGKGFTWPGKTFQVRSGEPLEVKWENKLYDPVTGLPAPHPILSGLGTPLTLRCTGLTACPAMRLST